MRTTSRGVLIATILQYGLAMPTAAQEVRPSPYPVVPDSGFQLAIERGTRTATGQPGPFYWQQWTDYELTARVLPEEKRLDGRARIRYHNNSPHWLRALFLHLYQNHHKPGMVRNREAEVTDGVTIRRVTVGGEELFEFTGQRFDEPGWATSGTLFSMLLPRPLQPGRVVELEIEWSFQIPQVGVGGRMGYNNDELFYIGYWYPQMVVLDDVVGWHAEQFLGRSEFYMGYGTYDVTVEVPAGWIVMGTGELTNPEEVLSDEVLRRYRRAAESDSVVHILDSEDIEGDRITGRADDDGFLTWHFRADSVRDVAFAMLRNSRWDAARTPVGDRDGDGTTDHTVVHSFWRESAPRWERQWRYARQSIAFLSRWTGLPYPWPHMTSVEGGGIESGGMEYPMMTLIGPYDFRGATDTSLYGTTAHELAHMWFPMIVGTDEKRYAWMDEGTTSFNSGHTAGDFYPGYDSIGGTRRGYLELARRDGEGAIMRWSDYHYDGQAYSVATYSKPATLLNTLRGLLGPERFDPIYREYIDTWAYKHPKPWDFFNFFRTAGEMDLDWFWRAWYYETWTLDHAVTSVEHRDQGLTIVVEDRGWVPMPARVTVTREDGTITRHEVPVDHWLAGNTRAEIELATGPPAVRVEIDAEGVFPDINRDNNVWERPSSR